MKFCETTSNDEVFEAWLRRMKTTYQCIIELTFQIRHIPFGRNLGKYLPE